MRASPHTHCLEADLEYYGLIGWEPRAKPDGSTYWVRDYAAAITRRSDAVKLMMQELSANLCKRFAVFV